MFSKKNYLKIIAEKPDIFQKIPDFILEPKKIEEYRQIPNLAVGEISGLNNFEALKHTLSLKRFDAFLPTISYSGTEYGDWGGEGSLFLKKIKKTIEKELKVYCADPVVLGSPQFWWALNGRFAHELYERFGFNTHCYGCRLYAFALRVPLCKMIDAHLFIPSGHENDGMGCSMDCASVVARYCSILMASFGIDVQHDFSAGSRERKINDDGHDERGKIIRCVLAGNCHRIDGSLYEPKNLNVYYESFALPVAGRIMSRILSGTVFDYVQEVSAILTPGQKINKQKKTSIKTLKN